MKTVMKNIAYLRIFLVLICLLCCLKFSWASNPNPSLVFSYENWTYGDTTYPYRKAVIAAENGQSSPILVVYLHGGSKRGNDNERQMKDQAILTIANYLSDRRIPAIMLVPQCPDSQTWGRGTDEAVRNLIEEYVKLGEIDACRIYLLGSSMGGTGAWYMASAYPSLFAAVMPVAGSPRFCDSNRVANTPVYTVMGSGDRMMSVARVNDFVNQLKEKGGKVIMDVEEGWGHVQTCTDSYISQRLDWLFSHARPRAK